MKIETQRIEWDADGEAFGNLPQRVVLDVESADDIANELSDRFGWCVSGVTYVVREVEQ